MISLPYEWDDIAVAMPCRARATHPNGRSLLRVSALCVGIAIAALFLGGCEQPSQVECIKIATGEKLTDTDNAVPSEMHWGFYGIDAQGFTRTVSKADAPNWKCRKVTGPGQ